MEVLTGIDLAADGHGGSMVLLEDIYRSWPGARVLTLPSAAPEAWSQPFDGWQTLDVERVGDRCTYEQKLYQAVITHTDQTPRLLHCQHLAFAMSKALLRAFPDVPALAICHGTDLIEAESTRAGFHDMCFILERVAGVVFPTHDMERRARILVGNRLSRINTYIVPWGVPIAAIQSAACAGHSAFDHERQFPRVLYAGRLEPEKGFDVFAESLRFLPRNLSVSVAAPETQAQAICRGAGAPQTIEYLGWLPRRRLWSVMAQSDVIVIPSTTLEAFGLTAAEAVALGRPLVCAAVDGLREVFADVATTFRPGDPVGLASAIAEVLNGDLYLDRDRSVQARGLASRLDIATTTARLKAISTELADQ